MSYVARGGIGGFAHSPQILKSRKSSKPTPLEKLLATPLHVYNSMRKSGERKSFLLAQNP